MEKDLGDDISSVIKTNLEESDKKKLEELESHQKPLNEDNQLPWDSNWFKSENVLQIKENLDQVKKPNAEENKKEEDKEEDKKEDVNAKFHEIKNQLFPRHKDYSNSKCHNCHDDKCICLLNSEMYAVYSPNRWYPEYIIEYSIKDTDMDELIIKEDTKKPEKKMKKAESEDNESSDAEPTPVKEKKKIKTKKKKGKLAKPKEDAKMESESGSSSESESDPEPPTKKRKKKLPKRRAQKSESSSDSGSGSESGSENENDSENDRKKAGKDYCFNSLATKSKKKPVSGSNSDTE